MASDLAFHLASTGWDVVAITARLAYEHATPIESADVVHGVRIIRVPTSRFGRHNLFGRAFDYATFYSSAFLAILRYARRGDTVIAMTDPPLLSVIAAIATTVRRARLVNWVQDLFPEVAVALGMRIPRFVDRARDWSLRKADVNVIVAEGMRPFVPKARLRENWASARLAPVAPNANALRREWNLPDTFVVAYSGNLGRAHDATTIVSAARRLAGRDIRFLFIGAGAQMHEVRQAGVTNATFQPYQPIERLSESLSVADAHLVSLNPAVEGLLLPSKFYGVLAVGRPVIFIGDPQGELAQIIREHRCGIAVAAGDDDDLAAAIMRLANDREEARAMGLRGRALYEERFAPALALADWERLLAGDA